MMIKWCKAFTQMSYINRQSVDLQLKWRELYGFTVDLVFYWVLYKKKHYIDK